MDELRELVLALADAMMTTDCPDYMKDNIRDLVDDVTHGIQ